jgi:beta-xylosidase
MLGDKNGDVPLNWEVPLKPYDTGRGIVASDDFSSNQMKINWQWNHNPVNDAWSLTERQGYLRLKTNRVVDNLFAALNTVTQRMEGPTCSGVVSIDISKMKDGDVAGFSAFNGDAGVLSVVKEGRRQYLTMSTNVVKLGNKDKDIQGVTVEEKERIRLKSDVIYLRIDGDFNLRKDMATFYYSLDNKEWTKIGTDFKMVFDYRRLFMGSKFAIFNYATKTNGGYVDVDFFEYKKSQK